MMSVLDIYDHINNWILSYLQEISPTIYIHITRNCTESQMNTRIIALQTVYIVLRFSCIVHVLWYISWNIYFTNLVHIHHILVQKLRNNAYLHCSVCFQMVLNYNKYIWYFTKIIRLHFSDVFSARTFRSLSGSGSYSSAFIPKKPKWSEYSADRHYMYNVHIQCRPNNIEIPHATVRDLVLSLPSIKEVLLSDQWVFIMCSIWVTSIWLWYCKCLKIYEYFIG